MHNARHTIQTTPRWVCLGSFLFLLGCSSAGTWTDDAGNWERAFRSEKPPNVVIVHSKYWRSPHWTMEYEYFFHIQAHAGLRKQLFEMNELSPIDTVAALAGFDGRPAWFTPKPPQAYETWQYTQEPQGLFRVFIDKETGDLFLADRQL